jgi:hypothetical protein
MHSGGFVENNESAKNINESAMSKMNPPQKTWYLVTYSYVDMADSFWTMADSRKTHEYTMSANE